MPTPDGWLAHAGEALSRKRFHPTLRRREEPAPRLRAARLVPVQAFECLTCGVLTRFENHICIRETR